MNSDKIIQALFDFSDQIRYAAVYHNDHLVYKQRQGDVSNTSSSETDRYEELLVNPTLLKLAKQRGNIDCGGLDYLIIRYGNFYQLVHALTDGHISICLDLETDLNSTPEKILKFLKPYLSTG